MDEANNLEFLGGKNSDPILELTYEHDFCGPCFEMFAYFGLWARIVTPSKRVSRDFLMQ